jgi:hypothetical protein
MKDTIPAMKPVLILFLVFSMVVISLLELASLKLTKLTPTAGYLFEWDNELGKRGASPHNVKGS